MAKNKPVVENSGGGIRALVFLILALVAGAAATMMVYQLVQSYQARIAEARKPEPEVMVIVAAADLYPGLPITEQDIVGINMPVKFKPAAAFTSPELIVGRIPRERILANEFILPERLADGETGVGLNALIPNGMRAISITIDGGAALSGFLNPGNIVDVLVTIAGDKEQTRETSTLLQAANVLAVNNRMLKEDNSDDAKKKKKNVRQGAPTVTFAVTPEDAEKLAHAERRGKITLTLRSDIDTVHVASQHIATDDLIPDEETKPAVKRVVKRKAPEGTYIKIIRGGQIENKRIEGASAN